MPKLVIFRLIRSTKLGLLFTLLLFPGLFYAQYWTEAQLIGSPAKEAIGDLESDREGNIYLSGTFGDQLTLGNTTIQSEGLDDVFLVKYQADGQVDWVRNGGGSNFDQTSALAIDAQGNSIWGGQFWIEGQFGALNLPLVHDSRGIFLLKYNPEGDLIWGRSIEGEGLKILADIQTDKMGNLYLTGYFANTLLLEDTTLQAAGTQSLFLLKFNPEGQLLWGKTAGYQGEVRPVALALNQQGLVVVSGDFQGAAFFGQDSIRTLTTDRDIFVAAYDTSGQVLWGRKAGGVYEDNCHALVLDEAGNSYLTGMFLGVLRLSDNLEITTTGFNENCFLIAYDANGLPWLAKSLGSTADESGNDLVLQNDQLFLTGHYYGNLDMDGKTLSGDAQHFNAFVAAFDLAGGIQWLHGCKSDEYIEGNRLVVHPDQRIFLAGNFAGAAQFDNLPLNSLGLNDVFLAQLDPLSTSVSDLPSKTPSTDQWVIFPNPTTGDFRIQWDTSVSTEVRQLQLVNLAGQVVASKTVEVLESSVDWSVTDLPAGIYYLQWLEQNRILSIQRVVIVK